MGFLLLSPRDVNRYVAKENAIIVDLRDEREYKKNHIEGAIWIPFENWEEHMDEFDRKKQIILYCDRGNKSMVVSRDLMNQGYRTASVLGGYQAYRRYNKSGMPKKG